MICAYFREAAGSHYGIDGSRTSSCVHHASQKESFGIGGNRFGFAIAADTSSSPNLCRQQSLFDAPHLRLTIFQIHVHLFQRKHSDIGFPSLGQGSYSIFPARLLLAVQPAITSISGTPARRAGS
jgi:hypothetical protein